MNTYHNYYLHSLGKYGLFCIFLNNYNPWEVHFSNGITQKVNTNTVIDILKSFYVFTSDNICKFMSLG